MRETLAEPLPVSGIDVPLGASIGIALYPDHATTADDLLKRADVAMRRFLVGAGCPLGQGYHFSRPVPAEQIPAYALQHT